MAERTDGGSTIRTKFYKYLGVIGIICIIASFMMGDSELATILGAFGFAAIVFSFIDEYRSKRR
jgi:positive regulator of sigma E activity